MRIKFIQKLIDRLRNKKAIKTMAYKIEAMDNELKDLYSFASFFNDQDKVYKNISFDFDKNFRARGCLKEVQDVNLYILKRIKKITEELDITIWLHGGTLLGAARHGGYIPWDDDIDIGIMRCDFEKLKISIEQDNELEIKNFYFVPGICSRQPRVVFKNKVLPFFVDIMVYDSIYSDDINRTWNDFCEKKNNQVRDITSLNICNDALNQISSHEDRKIIDAIYDDCLKSDRKQKANSIIINLDEGTNLINNEKDGFIRCFLMNDIFPLETLMFEGIEFFVPKNHDEYLIKQYGNYMVLPNIIEYSKHLLGLKKQTMIEIHRTWKEKIEKSIIGYTAGAFDLFHVGHLNILKNAKENCTYLIVGVTTDELVKQTKKHAPVIPLKERMAILRSCKYVDEVVIQDNLDKVIAWEKIHYNILFSGDDWKNDERWEKYKYELEKRGACIKYFPYTKERSTSLIRKSISEQEYDK